MKRLAALLLAVLILGSCSGLGWFPEPRAADDGSTMTIDLGSLPGPTIIPWDLEDGQMAIWRGGWWYLYEGDVLLDSFRAEFG